MESSAPPPILSICIPTYNRSALLSRHLAELDQPNLFPFPIEVIVADNCSTDDTRAVLAAIQPRNYRLSVVLNRRNFGAIANVHNSLRHATAQFCIFAADDDRLDIPALVQAVERMIAVPQAVATYTGWVHRDLQTGEFKSVVGSLLPDGAFDLAQAPALINALIRAYLFPEIALYRTSALVRTLFPGRDLFWPFLLIDRLLQLGVILTTATPFYQVVDRHPGELDARASTGRTLEKHVWTSIHDGMDFLVAKYLGRPAAQTDSDPVAGYLAYMSNQSFFSSVHRGRYAEAFETAQVLDALGRRLMTYDEAEWSRFLTHVALENAQSVFETLGDVDGIACIGFQSDAFGEVQAMMEQIGGPEALPISQLNLMIPSNQLKRRAVLTATDAQRQLLIAKGQSPGRVLSLEDLRNVFRLS